MRRSRRSIPGLTEGQLIYFLYGCDMMDGITAGFKSTTDERECYEAHRDIILHEYIKSNPCSRPGAWWKWNKGISKPKHPNDDFLDPLYEAETIRDMKELRPDEYAHLEEMRAFYGKYQDLED